MGDAQLNPATFFDQSDGMPGVASGPAAAATDVGGGTDVAAALAAATARVAALVALAAGADVGNGAGDAAVKLLAICGTSQINRTVPAIRPMTFREMGQLDLLGTG